MTAPAPSIGRNIKQNGWPLIIIAAFVLLAASFLTRNSSALQPNVPQDPVPVHVAFHKRDTDPKGYFQPLENILRDAFNMKNKGLFKLTFTYIDPEAALYQKLQAGEIDIAGELSPLQYVANAKRLRLRPLASIEYDKTAFYHSVLFVPLGAPVRDRTFRGSPGIDNLKTIKDLLRPSNKTHCPGTVHR